MSDMRKQGWIVVARSTGGRSSPMKYGLNCTMPAIVNITDGSTGTRLAGASAACPRSTKKRVNAARSWSLEIVMSSPCPVLLRCCVPGRGVVP